MKLKIISWNIWEGRYLDKVINFLKTSDADVIGLQEVIQEQDGNGNTAELIANQLGCEQVYATASQIEKDGKTFDRGNAILSKHKIERHKTYVLSEIERRIAIEADIKIENSILQVFNLHLLHTHQLPSEIQNAQVESLVKVLPNARTILMGDFNASPESKTIKRLGDVLINTDKPNTPTWSVYEEGCVVCKPKGIHEKLDYIFTTEDIKVDSFKVESSQGSDHLPISVAVDI